MICGRKKLRSIGCITIKKEKDMRKNIIVFAVLTLAVAVAFSQIALTFTGVKERGRYLRLDSVKVTNFTSPRTWTETVVFPDTVLVFATSGLEVADASQLTLSAYPNPSAGRTTIAVESPVDEIAVATVTNLAGQVVYRNEMRLGSGRNLFELTLGRQQVCLLSVATSQGVRTVKILNTGAGNGFGMKCIAAGPVTDKRTTNARFRSGDSLQIVGYAKNDGLNVCSYPIYLKPTASSVNTLVFATNAVFSVSDTTKVLFSPGKLQWSAKNGGNTATTHTIAGGGTAPGTWRFAPHQYDTIGRVNYNASSTYGGWIDLLGWATSGWDNTSVYPDAEHFHPWDTVSEIYGYGPYGRDNLSPIDITGANAKYDWGVYNAIFNPKTNSTDAPGTWRTPTMSEWRYLLGEAMSALDSRRRTGSGMVYVQAVVVGINGAILLPDNWSPATYTFIRPADGNDYSDNVVSAGDWSMLENAGCVFLPSNGYRYLRIRGVSITGRYWSSTANTGAGTAKHIIISNNHVRADNDGNTGSIPSTGACVRLVKDYR